MVEHVAHGKGGDDAVIVAAPQRWIEEEVAGFLKADERLRLVTVAFDIGVARFPIGRRRAVGQEYGVGHEETRGLHVGNKLRTFVRGGDIASQHDADLVGKNLFAFVIDDPAAVAIAVKGEADVGANFEHLR